MKPFNSWREFFFCFGFAYCLVAVVVMTLTYLVALFSPDGLAVVSVVEYGEGWVEFPLIVVGFLSVFFMLWSVGRKKRF